MKYGIHCANMNHGRLNAPVRYCLMCGDMVNKQINAPCDHVRHAALRKNRSVFCQDCGKKLG